MACALLLNDSAFAARQITGSSRVLCSWSCVLLESSPESSGCGGRVLRSYGAFCAMLEGQQPEGLVMH